MASTCIKQHDDPQKDTNITKEVKTDSGQFVKDESQTEESQSTTKEENKKQQPLKNDNSTHLFFWLCILGVILGMVLEILNVQHRNFVTEETKLKYWVYSASSNVKSETGLLRHLHAVLKRIGYEKSSNNTPWNLLWSHDYPFRVLHPNLNDLKPNQRVNHFPGAGFLTNKVDLAITKSKYIPRAFKLPEQKEDFMKYAEENPKAWFVEKDNQHRGIFLKNVSEIDSSSGKKFVQEYLQKPFLVDGHKFDIGVYVVITSINPLRAYWYKGDVLFRYCPSKYHPMDPKVLDKYVVADKYLATWQLPSLARPFSTLGFGMKDSFDVYAKSKGKDTTSMWEEVQNAIAEVLLLKEKHIVQALKNYSNPNNFFEMMRFDLIVDEELKVYLLEANMSPNLSADTKPPNQLLYEQVLYNLFSLVGISSPVNRYYPEVESEKDSTSKMVSTDKNIAVWSAECNNSCADKCSDVCGLCRHCLTRRMKESLLQAHREHLHRGDFRRVFPPSLKPHTPVETLPVSDLTPANKAQLLWCQGKCNLDVTWCN